MKLTYIGTAAAEAVPALFCECSFCENARRMKGREYRRRSGAMIDNELLIDFSPDTYTGTLALGLRLNEVKYVIFTHSHSDHFCPAELGFRRAPAFCIVPEGKEPLKIYGNRNIENGIMSLFGPDLSAHGLQFDFVPPFEPFYAGEYKITPVSVIHCLPEDAYIYLIEKDGVSLLYANDTGFFTDRAFEFLSGKKLDIVSLDCTLGHSKNDRGHMGFDANLRIKQRLTECGCVKDDTVFISNHFSHNGLRDDNDQWTYGRFSEMAAPYGFIMSYDGLVIEK